MEKLNAQCKRLCRGSFLEIEDSDVFILDARKGEVVMGPYSNAADAQNAADALNTYVRQTTGETPFSPYKPDLTTPIIGTTAEYLEALGVLSCSVNEEGRIITVQKGK